MEIAAQFPTKSEPLRKLAIELTGNKNLTRDNDLTIGCLKQYYNQGVRDFELTNQVCSCITATLVEHSTDAELDEWIKEEDKSSLLQKPWAKDLPQAMQRCNPGN